LPGQVIVGVILSITVTEKEQEFEFEPSVTENVLTVVPIVNVEPLANPAICVKLVDADGIVNTTDPLPVFVPADKIVLVAAPTKEEPLPPPPPGVVSEPFAPEPPP
jgi:hypothetical protein